MKRLSGLFQFLIGFIIGIAILVGGATAVAYMFLSRMNSAPPKPVFTEEKKETTTAKKDTPAASAKPTTEPKQTAKPEVTKSPEPKPKEQPKPQPEPKKETTAAKGYKARVTWQNGLSLRSEPTSQSTRVGGLDYNTEVSVVDSSSDGQWQKIRLSDGQEGWIKSGNITKVE